MRSEIIFRITLNLCIMQNIANAPLNNDDGFRLLSINAASKILGIRHKKLTEIIKEGKIKIIDINGKIKIPRINLYQFIEKESKSFSTGSIQCDNRKVPQSAKFILESIIKKHQ